MGNITATATPAAIRELSDALGYDAHEYVYDSLMSAGRRAEADEFADTHAGDGNGCAYCRTA